MFGPGEAIIYFGVFLFSVTFHEAAHAWVAQLGGDETAYLGGQVSLDPIPHIRREPFGMLILPLISLFIIQWPFGYASTPYDPAWAERHPKRSSLMALAGPVSNIVLMIVAGIAMRMLVAAGFFEFPERFGFEQLVVGDGSPTREGLAMLLSVSFSLNLLLALLNLIPVPPLDGSSAIGLLLPDDTARKVQGFLRQPMFSLVGILLAWRVLDMIFVPAFTFAVSMLFWIG